jgi:hypothetical protein
MSDLEASIAPLTAEGPRFLGTAGFRQGHGRTGGDRAIALCVRPDRRERGDYGSRHTGEGEDYGAFVD